MVEAPYAPYSGMGAMRALLELPYPPTAVFAFNDHIAVDAARAAMERGLKIPGDIAIAGFDNIPSSLITFPTITTVHQPKKKLGMRAIEILAAQINSTSTPPPSRVVVSVQLIVRSPTVRDLPIGH